MDRVKLKSALRKAKKGGAKNVRKVTDEILADLSDEEFTELAMIAIYDLSQDIWRSLTLEVEKQRDAAQEEDDQLSVTPRHQRIRVTPDDIDGFKVVISQAARSAAANWMRLADEMFDFGPGFSGKVAWLDATIEQHQARIQFMSDTIGGFRRDIVRHQAAIDDIRSAGGNTLRDFIRFVQEGRDENAA